MGANVGMRVGETYREKGGGKTPVELYFSYRLTSILSYAF